MRRARLAASFILASALATAPAAAAATHAEIAAWFASTPQIVRSTAGVLPGSVLQWQVEVRNSSVTGFVDEESAFDGTLTDGQHVMVVPLVSGGTGGIFYALLFTRLGGRVRFVGYIPSENGHLRVTLDHGTLLSRIPVYGPGSGGNCCPSDFRYERATLHGVRLVSLKIWTSPVR